MGKSPTLGFDTTTTPIQQYVTYLDTETLNSIQLDTIHVPIKKVH